MKTSHRRLLMWAAPLVLLGWGCATGARAGRERPDDPAEAVSGGIHALERGDYETASARFHRVAARCEAGADGRRAVLLLATAALDPRNPDASADRAARLAAHYLGLPGSDPDGRAVAETLFLVALGRGARLLDAPGPADSVPGLPPRFEDCEVEATVGIPRGRALPALPDTARSSRLRVERDSLRARVDELEAELERIRNLLQEDVLPDTSGTRP